MSRKTMKLHEKTKERFDNAKRDGETTDGLMNRALDALEADEDRGQYAGAPRCTDCSNVAHAWTVEEGQLVCGLCADSEIEFEE